MDFNNRMDDINKENTIKAIMSFGIYTETYLRTLSIVALQELKESLVSEMINKMSGNPIIVSQEAFLNSNKNN